MQSSRTLIFFLVALLAFTSSCSNESSTGPTVADDLVIDPAAGGDVFLGSTTLHNTPGVGVDVWGEGLTIESETVVSFDLVLVNKSDRPFYPPATFEVTTIEPDGVDVLNADAQDSVSRIFYLGDDFGDDNKLDPGERSAPVRIEFGVPGLTSFSIGYEVSARAPGEALISGTLFDDVDRNGQFDPTMEIGLWMETVTIHTTPTDGNPTGIVDFTFTDDKGAYSFSDIPSGVYSVRTDLTRELIPTTPNPLLVTLVESPGGEVLPVTGADFGFFDPDPPDSTRLVDLDVFAGTEEEAVFVNPASPSDHRYVLIVSEPIYFRAPVGALYNARVWINDTSVFEFECDALYENWRCIEEIFLRVDLPVGLVEFGVNEIRVTIDGWGEPMMFFSINRLPQD